MHLSSPAALIKSLPYTHSSALTAMAIAVISSLAWLPLNTSDASAANVLVYEGTIEGAAKATGEAWAIGQKLYWDAANSRFTTTASGNTLCGRAGAVALSADATGTVLFNSFET